LSTPLPGALRRAEERAPDRRYGGEMSFALLVLLLGAAMLSGCRSDAAPSSSGGAVSDAGMQHIHGLGVNPADGSLWIATHSGLFRAAAGRSAATRVGQSRQDTMGFTVVGADRFLGSGHPDPRSDLPPLLGLIRSDDAGRTWEPVSLLGQADFHVLRAAGDRIYGLDATEGRLLVGSDGGRSWSERAQPAPVIDIAVSPADPDSVVVSTEAGLFSSRDAGRTWRPLTRQTTGLIAWTPAGLTVVDGSGTAHASTDGGRRFEAVGEVGGQPAALAADGTDLYVALHTNEVRMSSDSGRTWRPRVGQ
jgi:photosystem II stability/assembly factor-like uncharacterized protein